MILSFKTKFKNGNPTNFIEKIWLSGPFKNENKVDYAEDYWLKIHKNWDGLWLPHYGGVQLLKPKKHTLREDIHNRWSAGKLIHFIAFNRSKNMFRFAPIISCESVQKIEIIRVSDYLNETIVKVDNRQLSENECQQLAWNDGFDNLVAFWLNFSEGFSGKIIHWTNLKY